MRVSTRFMGYRARFLDGQQLEGVTEQCRFRRTARPRSTPCIMRAYAPFWVLHARLWMVDRFVRTRRTDHG